MKDSKKLDELKKLKKQCDEYLNGWKRAKADLANYKKDIEKRSQELREFMAADLILDILPIHDHFKKALAHASDVSNVTIEQLNNKDKENGKPVNEQNTWLEGIRHIKSQLDKFLKDRGVEEIKTVGEKFSPEFHEAVSKHQEKGKESDTILKECSAGYTMNGRVIVPAKVIVAE
ncbi:nucleotide exchange factor GrpE [Patescibacteria group bacterium]|nr:nucleotide exchange factor GrpE [Patescibacteria group bacterium]MBU4511895.1 nucleotide exchange factor GrpE [Patescibacteria group bacterium]MCG2692862.1 nucleotide exchange factor GrpE [Candidatus Parcubacteria bacterium]